MSRAVRPVRIGLSVYERRPYTALSPEAQSAYRLGRSTARRDELIHRARLEWLRGNDPFAQVLAREARAMNRYVVAERALIRMRGALS